MKSITLIPVLLLTVLAPLSGLAYETIQCNGIDVKWDGTSTNMKAFQTSFPDGIWKNALREAFQEWNKNPSNFHFSGSFNDPEVGHGNGENEIWWSAWIGAPAVAYMWFDCATSRFHEVDIVFDINADYSLSHMKSNLVRYGGYFRPFQNTAIHELGHALGLAHESDEYNAMGQDYTHIYTNGTYAAGYVGEDTSKGAVALYGPDKATTDLAVVHWRWTGRSGEYSIHSRTRVFDDASGVELTFRIEKGEPQYTVRPGQQIRLELSYENNGSRTVKGVPVNFVLSTNDTITTWDRLIGSATYNLGSPAHNLAHDTVHTTTTRLTIPKDLTPNATYYLGAIIDPENTYQESNEANNASYVGIYVQWAAR